jgi:hypothetical protein
MADSKQLLVSAPLCFCFSKFGRLDRARIKSVLNDFFSAEDITSAKKRLLTDIEQFKLDKINVPKAKRRDSDSGLRASKEVDDILQVLTLLDERKMLQDLPCYVVDNTDNIPTMKLEDGEMKYFNRKLDRLEEAVVHPQACFNRLHDSGAFRPPHTVASNCKGAGHNKNVTTATNVAAADLIHNEPEPEKPWSAHVLSGHQSTTEMDTDLTDVTNPGG